MRRKWTRTVALLGLTGLLSACGTSWATDRTRNPVIEDYLGGTFSGNEALGSLATSASYRTVIMRLNSQVNDETRSGVVCPEPPPDVALAIAAARSASGSANVSTPAPGTTVGGSAAFQTAVETAVSPLLRRSQGVQFFRDAMYYSCVAYLNDTIESSEYMARMVEFAGMARELIAAEIAENALPTFVMVSGEAPADLDNAIQRLERAATLAREVAENPPGGRN